MPLYIIVLISLFVSCAHGEKVTPIKLQGPANYQPHRNTPHGTDPAAASNTKTQSVERNERVSADGVEIQPLSPGKIP